MSLVMGEILVLLVSYTKVLPIGGEDQLATSAR